MSLDVPKFVAGLQDYMARALRPLSERITRLEAVQPEKGEKGDQGSPGPAGEPGRDGAPGATVAEVLAAADERLDIAIERKLMEMERRAQEAIDRAVDRIPKPKDGRDALDIDDLVVEQGEGLRQVRIGLRRGDEQVVREITFPGLLYHGVWQQRAYEQGDCVTWGGALWICHGPATTTEKPGTGPAWQLAAKKGRDGKDKT